MAGYMQWRTPKHCLSGNAAKELYVQDPEQPWRNYRQSRWYTPNTAMTYSGMRTLMRCKEMGYQLLPTDQPMSAVAWQEAEPLQVPTKMPLSSLSEDQRRECVA